jgi:zinc protease
MLERPRLPLAARPARAAARRLLLATALLLCGCASAVPMGRQGLSMRDVSFPLRELRFPSGLRVLVEKDDRAPLVSLFLVVGAGSTSDPAGKEGLAHYVEHLAFRSRPFGKYTLRRMLERAGAGAWNARTGLDDTVYFELGPASALPELLRLEGTRMLAPVAQVMPEVFATELGVVRNELRQRNETGFIGEVIGSLQAAVFPAGHPYARPVIGSHESLSAIKPEDVVAFLKQHYRPDNMTLLILGNVDLQTIERLLAQSLPPDLLAAPTPVHPPPRMPASGPEPPSPPPASLARKEAPVATPELWIAWSLPRSFDQQAYLLNFAARAASAKIVAATREDEDITSVSASVVPGVQGSMLLCRVQLNRGAHPERSLDHVLNQLVRVWQPGGGVAAHLTGEALFRTQQRASIVEMVLDAENLLHRGIRRATMAHFSQDPALYSRSLRDMMALDRSKLNDFAQRYLNRERARAVLFTPSMSGGALPASNAVTAPAIDDEDTRPVRADEDRLRSIAPGIGVSTYRQLTLPNGLEVILGHRAGLPVAAVGLLLHGGVSEAADPAAAEAATLLAFPREKWHGDPADFGGRMSRRQTSDAKIYSIEGAAGNVGTMIAMMAERVRSMSIDSGQWPRFQRETVPFLRLAEQKPETIAHRAFFGALLEGHPYGRSVTGQDLEATSADAASAWITRTHIPQNAVLAVVGEIDPALVEPMVREQFEGWRNHESVLRAPGLPSLRGTGIAAPRFVVTHRPGASQSQIHFGCLLPAALESAMDVRHDVAAQLVQDRMLTQLRQRLGVTYGLSAIARVMRGGTAFLSVNGAVESGKLGPALVVLRDTLKALADTKAPDNELAWAKLRQAHRESTSFMTNEAIVEELLANRNVGFSFESDDTYARELATITGESVQQDFQMCAAGRPTLSIIGDDGAVKSALREAWP